MKKSELLALLAEKGDDEEVGVLATEQPNPQPAPQPEPQPQPKPTEIKADTVISGTVAEILQQLAPILNKSEEKPKPQEEESAEVYI